MSSQVVTWYDFLLKTADLDEYLLDYSTSPSSHPKPGELLVAFLQRLMKQEEDSLLKDSQYSLRLAELSLKITCQHFRWSLPELDQHISIPLQHQLMTVLNRRLPLTPDLDPSSLDSLSHDQLVAQFLHSCWVIRLVSTLSSRDGPCKRMEIKSFYNDLPTESANSFLHFLLTLKKDILPSTPFLTPPESKPLSISTLLTQTHFELGRYSFHQMNYTQALTHFSKSSELFSHRGTRDAKVTMLWINSQQLQAFLDSTLLLSSEETSKILEQRWHLEHLLLSPAFPPILDLISKPYMTAQLSKGFYHRILAISVKTQPFNRPRAKTDGVPSSKRSKLDTSPEEVQWKLSLLAAIKCHTLSLPSPSLIQLFTQMNSREEFDCFHRTLNKLGFSKRKDSPGRPHSTHEPSPFPLHLAHLLFSNMYPDLREVYDPSYIYKSVHASVSLPDPPVHPHLPSLSVDNYKRLHSKPPHHLKLSPTHQAYLTQWNILNLCDIPLFTQLISAIGSKPLSDAQHFATQWTVSHKPFLQIDQVSDHILLTRINAALHLGSILQSNKHLELACKYFRTAVDTCQSANLKPYLSIPIHEKFVLVQIEAEISQAKLLDKYTFPQSLVDNAKQAFSKTTNGLLLQLTAAFLLNCKDYKFFSSDKIDQAKFATGLANCCLALMESSELRRHGRQIFDAMFRIMEGQREQDTELKTGLGIFFNNLVERLPLSLSISCFVKLVTLLENPKWEISSEHTNCWPAAIPNVERLDRSQVSRFFLSLLDHAIAIHPTNCQSWLLTKADYLFNNLNYNMALKLYIEAGALATNYFEAGVTPDVWTEACLRHMLDCLSMLRETRYALLLSQLLRPVDYQLSLNLVNELFKDKPIESATPTNFIKYIWDINVLEYLGYFSFQKKRNFALNGSLSIIPPDLNTSNSEDILTRAVQWRRTEFLRSLADYLLIV